MGFLEKKKVAKKEVDKEEPEAPQEEIKGEGKFRLITNEQLINFKLDGIENYIKELDASFRALDGTIKKAMED